MAGDMEQSILALEHSFLKVPHEQISKTTRAAGHLVDAEFEALNAKLEQIVSQTSSTSPVIIAKEIDGLMKQLMDLKAQLSDMNEVEQELLSTAALRIEHLRKGMAATDNSQDSEIWKQQRLDRIICDHLLRVGHYETAEALASLAGIESFTNVAIFRTSKAVEDALHQKDCGPALGWCSANRARLTKLKSTLEFKLHMQNFVMRLKSGDREGAITYARDNFPQHVDRHLSDIQTAMALLIFKNSRFKKHTELLSDERWDGLVQQFRRNIFALHSLSGQSTLDVTLQSGLSVLKNYDCQQKSERNVDCPVCAPNMNALAAKLPLAHHMNSRLVCRISGALMNEDNPPMALPNGNVYSQKALEAMASERNGFVQCPRTDGIYLFSKAQKVFIM